MSEHNTEVRHEAVQSRYAIFLGEDLAGFADYVENDGVRDFNHTVVLEDFQGKGLSKPLIRQALEDSREQGFKIRPTCSAVEHFLAKNPEFEDLRA